MTVSIRAVELGSSFLFPVVVSFFFFPASSFCLFHLGQYVRRVVDGVSSTDEGFFFFW